MSTDYLHKEKKRKWLTVAYICTAREICAIPMFMQSFQKNACMGQMGLEIGCLAPPRYQAEPQVLGINQMLPVGKSTVCRVGAMEKVPLWTLSFHLIPRVLEKIASLLQSWYYLYSTWVSAGEFWGELDSAIECSYLGLLQCVEEEPSHRVSVVEPSKKLATISLIPTIISSSAACLPGLCFLPWIKTSVEKERAKESLISINMDSSKGSYVSNTTSESQSSLVNKSAPPLPG